MLKSILLSSLLISIANASADFVGFTETNNFLLKSYKGNITVYCRDLAFNANWDCEGKMLNHDDMEYFYHSNKQANRFSLIAHHSDGSHTEKSGEFLASKGRSKYRVNLWIGSVLQEPLLSTGSNRIEFRLYDGQKLLESGEFNASVRASSQTSYSCPSDTIYSRDRMYCFESRQVCQDYFDQVISWCEAK